MQEDLETRDKVTDGAGDQLTRKIETVKHETNERDIIEEYI